MTEARTIAAMLVFTVIGLAAAATAETKPIACRSTKSPAEKIVCASSELVAMDREIAALYDRGRSDVGADGRKHLANGQAAFLRQRKDCSWASHHSAHPGSALDECVRGAMDERLRVLRRFVDRATN